MTNLFLSFLEISISVSVIVIVLTLLSPFLSKRYASKWKYWVWIFLALRLLIAFRVTDFISIDDTFLQTQNQEPRKSEENGMNPPEQDTAYGQITVEIPKQVTTPLTLPSSKNYITILDIIALIWISGSLIILSVHLISYLYYRRQVVKKGTIVTSTYILHQISELKRELQIKGSVSVVEYPEAVSPMIIGFFNPVLILPKECYNPEELFFILKHELVHLKRRDIFIKLLFVMANSLHWFNPFIWMMQKEAVIDMELSCDERVTQDADYAGRKAYTETLLSTLHKHCKKNTVLSTGFYGGVSIMKKRFKNILGNKKSKNGAFLLVFAIVLTASLGTLIVCSAANGNAEGIPDMTSNGNAEDIPDSAENAVMNEEKTSDIEISWHPDGISNLSYYTPDTDDTAIDIPQNGQIYGYISDFGNGSVIIDRQIWATYGSEDWKPEYDEDAGFEVVDAEGEDISYPISEDCTYSILENHNNPVVALDKKGFEDYLSEMKYPVLWIIELENGQIKNIMEQYRP